MKKYKVVEPFWHKSILQEVGAELTLADAEAKYRQHELEVVRDEGEDPQASAESLAQAEGVSDPRQAPAPRDGRDPETVAIQAKIAGTVKARSGAAQ